MALSIVGAIYAVKYQVRRGLRCPVALMTIYLLMVPLAVLAALVMFRLLTTRLDDERGTVVLPSTPLSTHGWYGFVPPQRALLWENLFDLRYGLFAFCPMWWQPPLPPGSVHAAEDRRHGN